jgi:hypothetical protein
MEICTLLKKNALFKQVIASQRSSFCEAMARHLRHLRKIKQVIPT